jgi:hypothetical protein
VPPLPSRPSSCFIISQNTFRLSRKVQEPLKAVRLGDDAGSGTGYKFRCHHWRPSRSVQSANSGRLKTCSNAKTVEGGVLDRYRYFLVLTALKTELDFNRAPDGVHVVYLGRRYDVPWRSFKFITGWGRLVRPRTLECEHRPPRAFVLG